MVGGKLLMTLRYTLNTLNSHCATVLIPGCMHALTQITRARTLMRRSLCLDETEKEIDGTLDRKKNIRPGNPGSPVPLRGPRASRGMVTSL